MAAGSDDPTPSLDLSPPTASRGDQVMQARIAERLFGETSPARHVAHYELLRRVGAGGMGVVYAAHDPHLDRIVALKQVRRNRLSTHHHQLLLSEARALAKLSHPNVVQVYEVGEDEGDVYIAMEFIDGVTLAEWQRTPRAVSAIVDHYRAAGAGLLAAHEAGLVHRDFKPSNVLVGADGRVRVVDFGLADLVAADPESTLSGSRGSNTPVSRTVAGTPGYIAPEVLSGNPATRASDLYSLCVALWEAVSGELPPDGGRRAGSEPGSRRTRWPGPRWLELVLRRGLAPEPADRWPSVAVLIDELERGPKRRRQWGVTGVSVVVSSVAVIGALWLVEPDAPALCEAPQTDFEAVWSGPRRERLQTRLRATPLPDPDRTVGLVSEVFEQYGRAWVASRTRSCTDHAAGNRSSTHFDRVNECLDRGLAKAGALLEAIDQGDLAVHARIPELLTELDDPGRCVGGGGPVAPPEALHDEVDRDHRALDHARVELAAGRIDVATAELEALAQQPAVLGYSPLRAEVTLARGRLLMAMKQPEPALDALVDAAVLAEQEQLAEVLFEARRQIVAIEVRDYERPNAARRWLAMTTAAAEGLDDRRTRPALLEARAEVQELEGQLARAEATLREATDLAASAGDRVAQRGLRLRLANVIAEAGRTDEALDAYAKLEAEWVRELGPNHPAIAPIEFDIGLALVDLGQTASAQRHLETALRIHEATYGADSPRLSPVLTMLADIANDQARYTDAIALAERAWAIQSQALAPGHSERGTALMALGWAQVQSGLLADALVTHEQLAVETEGQLTSLNAAYLQQTLGWLRCRVDACAGAKPHFELARANGDDTTKLQAGLGLANVELAEGRAKIAVEALERLLPKVEALSREDAPEAFALAQWMLARALVDSGVRASSARVQALAQAAQVGYQTLPPRPDIARDLNALVLPTLPPTK